MTVLAQFVMMINPVLLYFSQMNQNLFDFPEAMRPYI